MSQKGTNATNQEILGKVCDCGGCWLISKVSICMSTLVECGWFILKIVYYKSAV